VRGVLARWILLATTVAFVLLGRPTQDIAAPRTDDEQARSGAGDDVSLRTERRPSTVVRMVGYGLDDDEWSVDLDAVGNDVVTPVAVGGLAFGPLEHEVLHDRLWSSSSARGPPVALS
jgi:hypothetical protein